MQHKETQGISRCLEYGHPDYLFESFDLSQQMWWMYVFEFLQNLRVRSL